LTMQILITICARGGSKGIPGKNIRPIAGKPLIGYSIDIALRMAAKWEGTVGLSTDSEEIKSCAAALGLTTDYLRPAVLGTDQAGKIPVIADLLRYEEERTKRHYDFVLDLDVTSPLRNEADLADALRRLEADPEAFNIFSVNPANRNPYFNMVEPNGSGYYELCKKGTFLTRQSAPPVYDLNASFYIYRRAFFDKGLGSAITDRSLVYVMPHPCFDLDHPIDFEFMQYLIEQKKADFLS